MSVGVTIAVASAVALALALCFGWMARRSFKQFEHEAELNLPLIDSEDRRLDAALRDAEEGYNTCAVCAFENFKRFRFCMVCGGPIVEEPEDEQGGEASAKKERTSIKSSLRYIFGGKGHAGLTPSRLLHAQQTTRRRLRAQKRKEWTRKLDVEGRVYWFRDGRYVAGDTPATAFVAEFEPRQALRISQAIEKNLMAEKLSGDTTFLGDPHPGDEVDAPTGQCSPVPDSQLVGNSDQVSDRPSPCRPSVGPVEERVSTLTKSVSEKRCRFIPTSEPEVDASKLPLDVEIGPSRTALKICTSTSLNESMTLVGKDFPSKYAHFVMTASALLVPADREHLRLNVKRESVFRDSMESLAIIPLRNVHSVLRIHFIDEKGVDAGGLHREWFVMLNEALVEPAHGLFVCANKSEQTFSLSPCIDPDMLPQQLLQLFAAGRLLGRALLEGSMLCFHLAPPLLKLILGYPLSFEDLEDLDPEVYTSLRWLLDNDGSDALGLDFTVTVKDGDHYHDVELVPGGSEIAVNDDNKSEFVERKWKYLMAESVEPQLQVFLQGLYEIIPRELLLLFDPEEFDFLLCGSKEIDVDDWERNTKHSKVLYHHRALGWFWELVREMPDEYRRRLLQFSTGSSRVPLGGFSALTSYDGRLCPFTLKAVPLVGDGFIHSHACFNRLDLPLHVVREELKAVLYAMLETEVYGFTTD